MVWNKGLTKETDDRVRLNALHNIGKHSGKHKPYVYTEESDLFNKNWESLCLSKINEVSLSG